MRISDWSSDVCSSDLEESGHGSPRASGIEFDPAGLAVALEHDLPALADAVERLGQLAGAPEGLAVDRDDDVARAEADAVGRRAALHAGDHHARPHLGHVELLGDRKSTRLNSSH